VTGTAECILGDHRGLGLLLHPAAYQRVAGKRSATHGDRCLRV